MGTVDGVRVNCVCPHTVATDAVRHALETRTLEEIAPPPATILDVSDVSDVVASVRRLIEDDSISGSVLVLAGRERPRVLQTSSRLVRAWQPRLAAEPE